METRSHRCALGLARLRLGDGAALTPSRPRDRTPGLVAPPRIQVSSEDAAQKARGKALACRSFVRLLHLHVHARARTRARVRSREGAKRRPVLEPAKSGRSKELRAAPAATHGRYCASAETTPYIRGNTRYALRPSPRGGDETNQLALDSTSNRYASLVGVDHYQSDWYQRPQRGTTSRGGGASAQRPAPPLRTAGVPAAPGERASALRPARSPRVATTALKRQSALPHPLLHLSLIHISEPTRPY